MNGAASRRLAIFGTSALPRVGLSLIASAFAAGVSACENNLPPTNPDFVYTVEANGTVIDRRFNLMWKRCSEGQLTAGDGCGGTATSLDWAQALATAEQSEHAGHDDWRLPNVKELLSLVEFCRTTPAINPTAFPATPASAHWSSSLTAAELAVEGDAWCVDFLTGGACTHGRDEFASLRLVRNVSP